MSYLACHVQKFKVNDVGGIQRHIQRETEGHKNKDIDNSKSDLNYDLHLDHDVSFKNEIKNILDEYYTGKKAIRKDAVVMTSTIITSDKAFFDRLGEDETKRFFQESYNKLKDIYGENNIISARVHMDETTPHMHLTAVPMTQDGKLSAKECISRENLRKMQDDIPKYLQEKGFAIERGVENSQNKHVEVHEFKKQTLEKLNKELERDIKELENIKSNLQSIKDIYYKKVPLSNTVTLKKQDFERLSEMAQKGIEYKHQNAINDTTIQNLKADNEHLRTTVDLQLSRAERANSKINSYDTHFKNLNLEKQAYKHVLQKNNLLDVAEKLVENIQQSQEQEQSRNKSRSR
ncbi:MAG: plasmid recombination protein [Cetobacterium sp.]|nr:plasmid recombination protein [Cetobacterium sp.]